MALFGAYKYLTSSGDEQKVSSAHKTLTYAAVGIAVAILAAGFPNLVSFIVGGTGGWGCGAYRGGIGP